MRSTGRKQLLTSFSCDTSIERANRRVSDRRQRVINDLGHYWREVELLELLDVAWTVPRSEVAHLPVVAVVGEEQFGADQEDAFVQSDYTAVVADALVADWPVRMRWETEEERAGNAYIPISSRMP